MLHRAWTNHPLLQSPTDWAATALNDLAKILWELADTDWQRGDVNQLDIVVVVDKVDKKAVMMDVAFPNDIRQKNHGNLETYQDLGEQ